MNTISRTAAGVLAASFVLAACSGGGGGLTFEDVRGRAQLESVGRSAIYMTITNDGDEDMTLVGAQVPAEIAGYAEIHETVPVEGDMADDAMSEGMDDDAMSEGMDDDAMSEGMDGDAMPEGMAGMEMRELTEGLVIAAGSSATLEPGGLHVMLFDLAADMTDGQTFDVTLEFADGSTEVLEVTVTLTP